MKSRKKEPTLTRKPGVSVKLLLWYISTFNKAKISSFKHTYFSQFFFRMNRDKELVLKLSCYKIISRLLKKTPKEEKDGIPWRKKWSRVTKHSCISYIFSICNVYSNSNVVFIYSSILYTFIYIYIYMYICVQCVYIKWMLIIIGISEDRFAHM